MSEWLSIVWSSRSNWDREENDFYPSPSHTIDDLLRFEEFYWLIREPACWDWAMSKRLGELWKEVYSSDLIDRGYWEQKDFLNSNVDCKNIITNPPYKLWQEFIEKSLEIVKEKQWKVAMLMKLVFLESTGRYSMFKNYPLKKVLVYSKRITFTKNWVKIKWTGMIAYARFIWDWSYKWEPMIDWIK